MAAPDVSNSNMQSPECIPTSGVAEDMVTIFGPSKKVSSPLPAQSVIQAKRYRARLPLVSGLALAGLATILTAGVLAGQNAVNGTPKLAEPRTSQYGRPPIPRSFPTSERIVTRSPALQPEVSPSPSLAATPTVRAFDDPVIPARLTTPIERTKSERRPFVIPKSESIGALPREVATPVSPVRLLDCNEGSACLQSSLYTADRDLRGAYNDAASAGVNARDLRAYRNEWLRARSLVGNRPKEALRIYGMIASDLRLFTDEALGKFDGDPR